MNRVLTPTQIDAYHEQGFVHLQDVLDQTWVERLRRAIARVEAEAQAQPRVMNLTSLKRAVDRSKGRESDADLASSDYLLANNAWQWNEALRDVAFTSGLPALAAQLMGSSRIRFYFDQVFIKPPGSLLRTRFHQDLGYWTCRGDQICTFWTSIDPVSAENGAMGYVPGSHRWPSTYKANQFVSGDALADQQGEDLPDIEADEARYGVVYCDCAPGDVIVHHVKTVHGSTGNTTADRPRRSAAFRYTGDDVTYHLPPGVPANSTPISETLQDGDPLSGDLFPLLWPPA